MAAATKTRTKTPAKKSTAVQKKSAPKSANTPKRCGTRSVQKVPAKQVTKLSSKKGTAVAVTGDLFRGAKYVEITENAISVTHAASRSRKGSFEQVERRRYLPQTPRTIAAANAALDEATRAGKVKKIRVEFK